MGIDVFQLSLNTIAEHIYRPGEIVTGNLNLTTSSDVDLNEGVTITVYGKAKVEWKESNGNHSSTYTGEEDLLENSIVLGCSFGQNVYPFSIQIPPIPALPWSMVSMYGRVEYGVKAVLKRPWFKLGNKKSAVAINVHSYLNSRIAGASKNPDYYSGAITSHQDETKAGCCCIPFCCWYLCSNEKIKLNLSTQTLWAYPGDGVPFTLEVDNTTTRRHLGNAQIQLVGVWLHQAHHAALFGGGVSREKTCETIIHEETVEMALTPGEIETKKGIFTIPMDVMPTQVDSSVLKLTYKLRGVMNEISGFLCIKVPATVEVDVLIATLGADEFLAVK